MTGRFPPIRDPVAFQEALETLFRRAEAHPDPVVRELVLDVAEAVMHLHHDALFRVVTLLRNVPGGDRVLEVLRGDLVVGTLLAEHGLLEQPPVEQQVGAGAGAPGPADRQAAAADPGPADRHAAVARSALADRVTAALDRIRPYMHGHGGDVEVVEVRDGTVRLRLAGACHGCAASLVTLRAGIEQALREAVPEVRRIEVEGLAAPTAPAAPTATVIPVEALTAGRGWRDVGAAGDFPFGTHHLQLNGSAVLLASAFGRLYAVRDRCPRGGGSLRGARLEAFLLVCPCHGDRYDLRSGRHLRDPALALEPLPLVVDAGRVRVAVG